MLHLLQLPEVNTINDQDKLAGVVYFCKDLLDVIDNIKTSDEERRLMHGQITILFQALHEFGDKRNMLDSDSRKLIIDNLIALKNKNAA